jgi:CheY-like chemotaxis protein
LAVTLEDRRILVVEDEFLQAMEVCTQLKAAGAVAVGPVGGYTDAMAFIAANNRIDLVVLDISLGEDLTFPIADVLSERDIPFIFTTGYSQSVFPSRFADAQFCGKPLDFTQLLRLIGDRLGCG